MKEEMRKISELMDNQKADKYPLENYESIGKRGIRRVDGYEKASGRAVYTIELRGIYTLWLREVKRYGREKTRLISSFVQPLLWLVIFGSGMRFATTGIDYQKFIFPGIIGQTCALYINVHGYFGNLG